MLFPHCVRKVLIVAAVQAAVLFAAGASAAPAVEQVLEQFEPYAAQAMKDWKTPGMAVAVVKDGRTIYAKGFGVCTAGENEPVTPDTVFQVGSTTKAFTSALMAMLVDEGKVGWNDPVIDHMPQFRMYDPWVTAQFTIHDLFAQHSGMQAYAGDLQSILGFSREHIIRSMRFIPPVYSFRDDFSYVNNLFLAGAAIIENTTGKSWEENLEKRILEPLGMTRSSLDAETRSHEKDTSSLHALVNGRPEPVKPGSIRFNWPYLYGPAGGLDSSANDMARWLACQMNGGTLGEATLFSKEAAAYMHMPQTPIKMHGTKDFYCQGWITTFMSNCRIVWHNGGTSGINAFIGFAPDLDLGITVLTNRGDQALADALGFQFFALASGHENSDMSGDRLKREQEAAEAQKRENTARPKLAPIPALPLNAYAGEYRSPIYGRLVVKTEKNGLSATLGAQGQFTFALTHDTGNSFKSTWPEFSPDEPVFHFDFTADPDQTIIDAALRELNEDGLTVWDKVDKE